MPGPTTADLLTIRSGVQSMGRLADGILRLGPWGLGLDGLLSWIPGIGELFSTIAAAYLLIQGLRAGVPLITLMVAGALMGARTLFTFTPLVGPFVADLLPLHRWSAGLIVRSIDRRLAAREASTAA